MRPHWPCIGDTFLLRIRVPPGKLLLLLWRLSYLTFYRCRFDVPWVCRNICLRRRLPGFGSLVVVTIQGYLRVSRCRPSAGWNTVEPVRILVIALMIVLSNGRECGCGCDHLPVWVGATARLTQCCSARYLKIRRKASAY